ncbi:MAG: ATP-dependent sacrificial sulfur transferase LarE [Planctomycetota bacterium]
MTCPGTYEDRLARLQDRLRSLERVAVAFSGGVDSSALLHAARSVLGSGAVGVIADSPSLPRRELADARETAARIGAELAVISTDEMEDEGYRANRGDRCYFCKSALFRAMEPWARSRGFRALAFGEIQDDLLDDRPGARAAREFGVVAPLSEAGFTKEDVRRYAREAGLDVAEKPASACLASRIPVGSRVTRAALERVERCEEIVKELGFRQVRVRDRLPRARVEVGELELPRAEALLERIREGLLSQGYTSIEIAPYLSPARRDPVPATDQAVAGP